MRSVHSTSPPSLLRLRWVRAPPPTHRWACVYCPSTSNVPQVYRKSFKEFTDLRLVQQLGGHQGVVWTLKFSRNGKFLASGEALPTLSCRRSRWPFGWCSCLERLAGRSYSVLCSEIRLLAAPPSLLAPFEQQPRLFPQLPPVQRARTA